MSKSVWQIFSEECPDAADAYIKLSSAINKDSALDEKTRCLILVGIYSTTRDPVALRHFTRMAFNAGASKEEIQAAALLAFNTGVSSAELSIPLIKEVADSL
ncbi:MAG TPA: carboxymuconolactone decarboxylase family protein [Patescibacteria group bacterium]|nr:carboxymuconolactone decarboxylase family protein [Patescibacteria group bacterium]